MRTFIPNKKRYGITATERRNRRRSKIQQKSNRKPTSSIAMPAADASSYPNGSTIGSDSESVDFEFNTQADASPSRKRHMSTMNKSKQRQRKRIVIDSETSDEADNSNDDDDQVSVAQKPSLRSVLSQPFKFKEKGKGNGKVNGQSGDRITNLLQRAPSRSNRDSFSKIVALPTMTQRSSADYQDSDDHDDEMSPVTSLSDDLPDSQSLLHKSQSQVLTQGGPNKDKDIAAMPNVEKDINTDTDIDIDTDINMNLTTSEPGKESDDEGIELVGRRNQRRSSPSPSRSSINHTADDHPSQEDELEYHPEDVSWSSSRGEDGDDPSSEEFLPTQEAKRRCTTKGGKEKIPPSSPKLNYSRPRRKCAASKITSIPAIDFSNGRATYHKGAAEPLSRATPNISSSKRRQAAPVPKSNPVSNSLVVASLKTLSKLSDKLCSLKGTTCSSSNKSVQNIVNNIVKTMKHLFSLDYHACAVNIVNVTSQIMKGAFELRERHTEEVIVLINFCICIHCNLESASSKDIYNVSCKTITDSAKALVNDADIVLVVLELLVLVSSNEGSMKEEQYAMPLLNFLRAVPADLLVEHISNLDSERIGDCLLKLATSIPKLHSYWWIEITLAIIYKLRYRLLSSIDQLPKEKRSARIQLFRNIFDSIPYSCLEGIEALDPPLSNTIIKHLYKDGTPMYQDQSFLQWSREFIMDLGCDYISCYTCNGIYAPLNSEEYGLKIANIPWIDFNQGGISFYADAVEASGGNSITLEDIFANRHLVTISFDDLVDNPGILSDRERTLTISISSEQLENTGLGFLLSKQCNRSDQQSCIEIFVKRDEYDQFKNDLHRRGVNVSCDTMLDESSASTIASLKSKMSRRNSSAVHKEVELSTKFGRKHPNKLLDAEAFIIDELIQKRDGKSGHFSPLAKHADNQSYSIVDEDHKIHKDSSVTTPAHTPYSICESQDSSETNEILQSQRRIPAGATEITPLNVLAHGSKLNFCRGALDTLGAVWGVAKSDLLHTQKDGNKFVTEPIVRCVADAVNEYHNALEKTISTMNALETATKQLRGLPIEQNILTTIVSASGAFNTIQNVKKDWDSQREAHERDLISRLC